MEFDTTVRWSKDERSILEDAIEPWRVMMHKGEFPGWIYPLGRHLTPQEMNECQEEFRKSIRALMVPTDSISLSRLKMCQRVMRHLRERLSQDINLQADPYWVEESLKMKADGLVPIAADPALVTQIISDIRQRQVQKTDQAITLLTQARQKMDDMMAQI